MTSFEWEHTDLHLELYSSDSQAEQNFETNSTYQDLIE